MKNLFKINRAFWAKKKLFLFITALCFSATMFAGGDLFEAWVTYSVNGEELDSHLVGKNTETAPVVDLGTVNKFQIDSFYIKVWQDNGDHFDKVDLNYKVDNGDVKAFEGQWKQDIGGNDKEWGIKLDTNFVAELADGDHVLELWFVGELNPGAEKKYLNNGGANYKFNFKKGTPEPKVTSWAIRGSFNEWGDGFNFAGSDEKALTTKVTVDAKKNYDFKLIRVVAQGEKKDTTWFGLNDDGNVMKYGNCTDWNIYESKGDANQKNIGLLSTKAGDYTFTLDATATVKDGETDVFAPKISVDIPEPDPDAREKRNIVLIPGELKSDNPKMIIFAFTAGKEAFSAVMEVEKNGEDTVAYKTQVPKELDSLIIVRAATEVTGWDALIWDGEKKNVWNQSEDQKLTAECDTARFISWGEGDGAKFKVSWCSVAPQPGEKVWYIKLPYAEGDWNWHLMTEEADGTWSHAEKWFGGGANLNTSMVDDSTLPDFKYIADSEMDFGENQVAPEKGTDCTFIWNPTTLKLAVNYVKPQGIENVTIELNLNEPIYNILGVEVDASFHGIVIQNGHKFIR